ncbi:MAG TPA: formimidoylglutamate deiminase [Streptosporangiaceae bacterium]|nr:formimidoylglutamate deiminase [Streptosporangiaceae bacterium]
MPVAPDGGSGGGAGQAPRQRYLCSAAWLGEAGIGRDVAVTVAGERIAAVTPGAARQPGDILLPGLVVPGFANAHSHAFHRALRGRSERGTGDFWAWRDVMYQVAERLTPGSYRDLARAAYAEMALAGITAVGEFHYLHHPPGGGRYADPNEMGRALLDAGDEAGVRVTLLDTCYLESAPGRPPEGVQARFSDGSAGAWASRVAELAAGGARAGAAIHSVRAVPPEAARAVAEWAAQRQVPLHFHLAEQPAEVTACLAAYGCCPATLLGRAGALGAGSWAVHATHLDEDEVAALAASGTGVCLCPTTERDLADGIGPARALARAGAALCLGSDSHAVIDPFEEMRAMEMDERLASGQRGNWAAGELLAAAAETGHRALGAAGDGRIAPGARADLVALRLRSPRLAGASVECLAESAVFAASPADVAYVVAGGRLIVAEGTHLLVGDVAAALGAAVRAVLAD